MARGRRKKARISLVFGDALKAAREKEKLSTTELGRRIEKSDAIISRYESGQQLPPKTTLEALEREVKVSLRAEWEQVKPEWDRLIQERKIKRAKEKNVDKSRVVDNQRSMSIKIEGYIAAGEGVVNFDDSYESITIPIEMLHRPQLPAFALRVKGDSMIDEFIVDGDVIILQAYTPPQNGMIVAALIDGDRAVCKRWYKFRNQVELLSANPNYPVPIKRPANKVAFKGVLVGLLRFPPLRPAESKSPPNHPTSFGGRFNIDDDEEARGTGTHDNTNS
jgi:repressor LexA